MNKIAHSTFFVRGSTFVQHRSLQKALWTIFFQTRLKVSTAHSIFTRGSTFVQHRSLQKALWTIFFQTRLKVSTAHSTFFTRGSTFVQHRSLQKALWTIFFQTRLKVSTAHSTFFAQAVPLFVTGQHPCLLLHISKLVSRKQFYQTIFNHCSLTARHPLASDSTSKNYNLPLDYYSNIVYNHIYNLIDFVKRNTPYSE